MIIWRSSCHSSLESTHNSGEIRRGNSSEGLVDIGVKSVVRLVGDVDNEQVVALLADPPVVTQTEAVVADFCQGSISRISGDVVDRADQVCNVLGNEGNLFVMPIILSG